MSNPEKKKKKAQKTFVLLAFNLFCDWNKTPPIYRLYVNDKLLTERTYIWNKITSEPCDFYNSRGKLCKRCSVKHSVCQDAQTTGTYLQEVMPLELPIGTHSLRLESLSPKAKL